MRPTGGTVRAACRDGPVSCNNHQWDGESIGRNGRTSSETPGTPRTATAGEAERPEGSARAITAPLQLPPLGLVESAGKQRRAPEESRRTIRLKPPAVDALKRHRARQAEEKLKAGGLYEDQGLAFAGNIHNPINPSNLRQRSFAKPIARAGLPPITFHGLRHTCASILFQRNVHPKIVQALFGHASVAVTLDTYSHMLPGMGGEAADALGDALG